MLFKSVNFMYLNTGDAMIEQGRTALQFYTDWQQAVAVILGMILQFAMGGKKGLKMFLTIAVSSVFIALFIVPAGLELINIDQSSKLANAAYALSALISVEILALMMNVMPRAASLRLKSFLGVQDDMQ